MVIPTSNSIASNIPPALPQPLHVSFYSISYLPITLAKPEMVRTLYLCSQRFLWFQFGSAIYRALSEHAPSKLSLTGTQQCLSADPMAASHCCALLRKPLPLPATQHI